MAFNLYDNGCKILIICFLSSFVCNNANKPKPAILSVDVINRTLVAVAADSDNRHHATTALCLRIGGANFGGSPDFRLRPSVMGVGGDVNEECVDDELSDHEFTILWSNDTSMVACNQFEHPLADDTRQLALCILYSESAGAGAGAGDPSNNNNNTPKWLNQGSGALFRTRGFSDREHNRTPTSAQKENVRVRRDIANASSSEVKVYGVRLESSDPSATYDDEASAEPTLLVGSRARVRLFGHGWATGMTFAWTEKKEEEGTKCNYLRENTEHKIDENVKPDDTWIELTVSIPSPSPGNTSASLYFCYKRAGEGSFYHLGAQARIHIREAMLPTWMKLVIVLVCLSFSSLFSGLNLGLLSLNKTDLKIISKTGTDLERKYAKAIYPVRVHGNYLLCSILLGNVLVNSIFTILLDDMSSGMVAVVVSTLAIVICGEICPQAVCSRHGLAIGAKTIYITKTVMVLTAPLAWPLSRLLDWILGEEIATAYTRERLKELVKVTTEFNDLEKDEVNIISGALELRRKTVGEVMTKIEDVYMLSYDAILDFETVSEIMKSGYSRIPVYEGTRRNIVSLLYIKDLALIDPDDNTPLKTLSQFYQNSCYYVFEDTTLDVVFKQFKDGCKGHMAFVHRVNNEGEGDPFYETVGIVTLEDVIEELIQAEIVDETDVYNLELSSDPCSPCVTLLADNRSKQRRSEKMVMRNQDFAMFAERSENQRVHISPQLNLATFQFLSSSVDAFKPENISEMVLLRLLKQDIIYHIKMKDKDKMKEDPSCIIYQQGKPADYFALILEGRVEVTVGRESLMFESGPFTYFGSQALIPNIGVAESPTNVAQPMGSLQSVNLESMLRYTFIPDYTVRAITEVFYIRVKRSIYLAAKKATLMEHSKKVSNAGEQFDDEVEKLLHNLGKVGSGDDDTKSQESRDGSFTHQQNLQYIEDSNRSSPTQTDSLNNGFVSGAVSPSRTPNTTDNIEEKATLLGYAEGSSDDRSVHSS